MRFNAKTKIKDIKKYCDDNFIRYTPKPKNCNVASVSIETIGVHENQILIWSVA